MFEARSGILSILHIIMSSVTLLWSILYQADSSEKAAAAAAAAVTTINLGSTKVRAPELRVRMILFTSVCNT